MAQSLKPNFYSVELNRTEWKVPKRYQKLTPVGSGAYGQVWLVFLVDDSFGVSIGSILVIFVSTAIYYSSVLQSVRRTERLMTKITSVSSPN